MYGNNFCGYVVLDSNILDQIYKSKYDNLYEMISILYNIIRKMLTITTVAQKLNL